MDGLACLVEARRGKAGKARSVAARTGEVWSEAGLAWSGWQARDVTDWHGPFGHGLDRQGKAGEVWLGESRHVKGGRG